MDMIHPLFHLFIFANQQQLVWRNIYKISYLQNLVQQKRFQILASVCKN